LVRRIVDRRDVGVYQQPDRLVLGFKGTISEAEL
jgi:hypothetical protein